MTEYLGIIFALIALVSWGVGDFFIQRSARKFGDWESIFAIEITGLVVLLPFVFRDLGGILNLSGREILILLAVCSVALASSVGFFRAQNFDLRRWGASLLEKFPLKHEIIKAGKLC